MQNLLWLLSVVSSLQCVTAQISLVESGPGTVKPTETLELTCKVTGASLTDSTNMYGVSWIRQPEGKGLEWLGAIYHETSTYYGTSVQGRLTLSRDTNKGEVHVKLTGVKPEESGKYYCARIVYIPIAGTDYAYFDIWGPGTTVTVTSAEQSPPSLFPLISCGTSQESTFTIGCLAKDFLPDSINFSWTDKSNNSFTSGFKKYNSVLQTSGTYAASTQITVTSDNWNKADPFYCEAKTAVNTKSLKVVPGSGAAHDPRKPIVTMHPPLKHDLEKNGEGTIVCVAGEFYPQSIKVSWLKNHKATTLYTYTEEVSSDGNGNFTIRSFITVPKKDWNEDAVITCKVDHSASGFSEMRNLSKSQVCDTVVLPDSLQVIAIPPSFETMYLTKTAPLTCLVTNMASVDGLDISWYEKGSETRLTTEIEIPVFHDNSTYSTKAISTVCVDDWLTKEFTCIVRHPELATPSQVSLVKENGHTPRTPTVLVFPPHQDEIKMGESLTMLCLVKGFYPKDIFVKWLIGDKLVEVNVVNTEPIVETNHSGDTTYFMYSKLTILNGADWNSGKTFTCLAGHESLPLQATQRSIDKNSGKPTSVNVSLIMSDSC